MPSVRERLEALIDRALPWYDVEAEAKRDRSLRRKIAASERLQDRADAVIASYRQADGVVRR